MSYHDGTGVQVTAILDHPPFIHDGGRNTCASMQWEFSMVDDALAFAQELRAAHPTLTVRVHTVTRPVRRELKIPD